MKHKRSSIAFCLLLCGCDGGAATGMSTRFQEPVHLDTRALTIAEPSGLSVGSSSAVLWAVGNRPERIYRLTVTGEVLETLGYEGDDLEGIAFDPSDSTLWIVEERLREVVHLERDGRVLERRAFELPGPPNSGLEGITLDGSGNLFLLNEKNPALLIALSGDLSIRDRYELDFARDYSGLAYDHGQNALWILSHEEKMGFLWSESEGLLGTFQVPFNKIEGIAVDESLRRLYVVSETDQALHIYTF